MRLSRLLLAGLLSSPCMVLAQDFQIPHTLVAGSAFNITTTGTGKATLYIVGPAQALRRDVTLGEQVLFTTGELYGAGHYVAVMVTGTSSQSEEFDVQPAIDVSSLGFLAKPSRLPVNIHNGISGAVYVFDAYHNLITTPMSATLQLAMAAASGQSKTVTTRNGLAWTTMDSATKEGAARFTARVGNVSSTHIINQVPGDPCSLSISARPKGARLEVQTAPVRDCNQNVVPDGTIVTFTEIYGDSQSTVDVPLKQGIASVVLPANKGAKISAASGVVAGNEIRWDGSR